MKKVTCQVVVTKDSRVMFKTVEMPVYNCKEVYEELWEKFRISKYEVKIIKKTTYQGYSEMKNITKETDNDFPF